MGLGAASRELESERLLLRPWREGDFQGFSATYGDEEMARYLGGRCDPPAAWRKMAAFAGHWLLRGFGYWAIEEKRTGAFVGGAGLWLPEGWPELELGYFLTLQAHGKGYATEAGRAARDHAWEVVGATSLVSYIHPANQPSKRVAARLGARLDEVIELLDHGPHEVHRYPPPRTA